MPVIDDLAVLLGKPLDEGRVESLTGSRGEEVQTERDPGHPEDWRRYYAVPDAGVQFLLEESGAVAAIFILRRGEDAPARPWAFRNGVNASSARTQVRAAFGAPERSGPPNPFAPGGWDRFQHPTVGLIHIQYDASDNGLTQVTLMRPDMPR